MVEHVRGMVPRAWRDEWDAYEAERVPIEIVPSDEAGTQWWVVQVVGTGFWMMAHPERDMAEAFAREWRS